MICAWVWAWPALGVSLSVSESAASVLRRFRQDSLSVEKGGQLFIDHSRDDGLWLARATLPHPRDKAGVHWLELDEGRCLTEVRKLNRIGLRWAGVWHSHAEEVPQYSAQDVRSLQRAAYANGGTLPYPLAVIVGRSTAPQGIGAWSLRPGGVMQAGEYRAGQEIATNEKP